MLTLCNSIELPTNSFEDVVSSNFLSASVMDAKRPLGWHCFFKSTWARFDLRFDAILDSLGRHAELVDKEASSFAIVEAKEWRIRRLEEISKQESTRRASQLQSVLNWLDIKDDEQENELEKLTRRCHPGSCNWIVKNAKLKSWMRFGLDQSILWLKGKPGSGMSFLFPPPSSSSPMYNVYAVL